MATKPPKEKPVEDTAVVGLVAYTDGGARGGPNGANPGYAGYGVHGYTYNYSTSTKGLGLGGVLPTQLGYVTKDKMASDEADYRQVKPLQYVESHTTIGGITSNTVAEITAATHVLNYTHTTLVGEHNPQFKEVTIIADYDVLINAGNQWLQRWKNNRWTKSDGSPIQGKEYWLALDNAINNLKAAGVNVNFKWVKGHSGDTGNDKADRMATLAVNLNRDGQTAEGIRVKEIAGYWSARVDADPLIRNRTLYFVTDLATQKPGLYYMGNYGKEQDMEGVRNPQGYYAIVQLKTPEPIIEALIARQNIVTMPAVRVILAYMDQLMSQDTANEIMEHGAVTLYPLSRSNRSLADLGDSMVTYDCNPPYKAWSAIESLNELKAIYDVYLGEKKGLMVQDITSLVYTQNEKGATVLNDQFKTGYCELQLTPEVPDEYVAKPIHLVMGIDLPIRNALKKMETHQPQIELISWIEGTNVWRYATVVTTSNGQAIHCAIHSNKILLKTKK